MGGGEGGEGKGGRERGGEGRGAEYSTWEEERREKVSDCERQRKNGVIRSCGERKELQEYKIKILSSDFPNFPNPLSTTIMLFLIIGNV